MEPSFGCSLVDSLQAGTVVSQLPKFNHGGMLWLSTHHILQDVFPLEASASQRGSSSHPPSMVMAAPPNPRHHISQDVMRQLRKDVLGCDSGTCQPKVSPGKAAPTSSGTMMRGYLSSDRKLKRHQSLKASWWETTLFPFRSGL